MKFTPKSEQELKAMLLAHPGQYKFTVTTASDEISKNGNEMIKLLISIWDEMGMEHQIYDYLLEQMPRKLRHFCEAVGLIDKYEEGNLTAENCMGKSGLLLVDIQQGSQKAEGGRYPDKNVVADYLTMTIEESQENKIIDDDLPF